MEKYQSPIHIVNENILPGNPERCRKDLIISHPFQTAHRPINFNRNNRVVYQYAKPNRHNRYKAAISGCDDYIRDGNLTKNPIISDEVCILN